MSTVETWIEEQDGMEIGHAPNIIEAKLHLDSFQKHYNSLTDAFKELASKGRGIAAEIARLEQVMFADEAVSQDSHETMLAVEETLQEGDKVKAEMDGMAAEWLQALKDCYQFHNIKLASSKVREGAR